MQEAVMSAQSTCAYGWMRVGQLRAAAQIQAGIPACCREPPWAGQSAVLTWICSSQIWSDSCEANTEHRLWSAATAADVPYGRNLLQWPPRKSEVFSQCKGSESLKKNLTTPPVPVIKTLPVFHKMNRRKTFCQHLVCFSSIHFHLPSEICAFLPWQHSYL